MNVTRKEFLTAMGLAGASCALGAGCSVLGPGCFKGNPAVQLYSIGAYIGKVGLEKTLADVAAIGYKAVEFAGYYGKTAAQLKKMLADNGLAVCGTHSAGHTSQLGIDANKNTFNADVLKKTCEFEVAYGNTLLICPGGGALPPGTNWWAGRRGQKPSNPSQKIDDFMKNLVDRFNEAAAVAKTMGCKIGLHNHTWEHVTMTQDGISLWNYFFANTCSDVCMEQDVGWTTCAGEDPVAMYKKYPHRSPTLHAKENGWGKEVKYDGILGKPAIDPDGKPWKGVDWDALAKAANADGVKWWVVECGAHSDSLDAIKPSYEFLKSKNYLDTSAKA